MFITVTRFSLPRGTFGNDPNGTHTSPSVTSHLSRFLFFGEHGSSDFLLQGRREQEAEKARAAAERQQRSSRESPDAGAEVVNTCV